jgi:hypothetical protein
MDNRLDRIEEKLDRMQESIQKVTIEHSSKLAKVETTQRGFIAIFSTLLAALVAYIGSVFHIRS